MGRSKIFFEKKFNMSVSKVLPCFFYLYARKHRNKTNTAEIRERKYYFFCFISEPGDAIKNKQIITELYL